MPLISKAFSNLITFSRTGSTATYFAANGVLTAAAADVPRFDYDPATFLPRGLLIEEARTNSIRNNTMQGAVAGTPGTQPTNWSIQSPNAGLTREIVGVGTQNGITYIDVRFSGTTTGTSANLVFFEPNSAVAASNGQTWTGTAWIALVGGSFANINIMNLTQRFNDAGGVSLTISGTSILSATSLMNRYSITSTASNASTAFVTNLINASFSVGVAIDITLRIGLPQLEQGAFATSVIPTTTTALTRNADQASVNTLSPWYNQTEGTVYAELQSLSPLTGAQSVALNKYPHVWQIEAGASDSTLWCYGLNSELYIATTYNNIGTVPSGINKIAAALAASGGQSLSSLNGAAAVNRNGTLTGTATGFFLGRDSTAGVNNFLNGYLRRITYYPTRLSNAQLQTITT